MPKKIVLLAAIDNSPLARPILLKTAELARRSNGEVVVLHVIRTDDPEGLQHLKQQTRRYLADIRYQFITATGPVPEAIIHTAQAYRANEIVMGKRRYQALDEILIGSVSQGVLENSSLPIILIEGGKN